MDGCSAARSPTTRPRQFQTFDIHATSGKLRVSQLSGGNQQKVVLARELSGDPSLIVAMQPTRGLDVGATEYVQQALLTERQRGAAILYISTELEEIMMMSDRIAVLYEGRFVAILDAATATAKQLGLLMAGSPAGALQISSRLHPRVLTLNFLSVVTGPRSNVGPKTFGQICVVT